jgi:hypothetical protein
MFKANGAVVKAVAQKSCAKIQPCHGNGDSRQIAEK